MFKKIFQVENHTCPGTSNRYKQPTVQLIEHSLAGISNHLVIAFMPTSTFRFPKRCETFVNFTLSHNRCNLLKFKGVVETPPKTQTSYSQQLEILEHFSFQF